MTASMPILPPLDTGLCYAVGDIHGYAPLLRNLLAAIAQHAGDEEHRIVFLGDYIDKGPASAEVLDILMDLTRKTPDRIFCLRGNHDHAMAEAASSDLAEIKWRRMGGDAVLREFGVARAADLPARLRAWVAALPTWLDEGTRYFVHAGLDPDLSLDAQTDAIRMTMRGRFLTDDHDFGRHVVHGHTPQMNAFPTFRPYRTNLDTGIYQTGVLSAAAFRDRRAGPSALLQVSAAGAQLKSLPAGAAHE
jgi:serine/threonine protein phosphatase 1